MYKDLGNADFLCNLKQAEEVVDMRVDTAIGYQTEKMQAPIPVFGALERVDDVGDFVHLPFLQGQIDPHNVLPYNTASANVEMADLAVAHEAVGQTNGERRGINFGVALRSFGIGLRERGHDGGIGGGNRITVRRRVRASNSPTVDDDLKAR
jgi:hypothetical protein